MESEMGAAGQQIWRVTFSDGSWAKMLGAASIESAWEEARAVFGEFSKMESLPNTDAAAIAAKKPAALDHGILDIPAAKEIGNRILMATVREWCGSDRARTTAAKIVVRSLGVHDLQSRERRFVADYCMAQLGFGGGL
jgi:hypothetical protein